MLYEVITLPEKDLAEQDQIVAAVYRWLEQHSGWLLIFDNAVKPDDLRSFLPKGSAKRVLITSRYQDWGSLGRSLTVQTWPREEAVDFLLKRTQQSDPKAADDLAAALGDLPLALEQAAAYIRITSYNVCYTKLLRLKTIRGVGYRLDP